jgi:hypothetical protein
MNRYVLCAEGLDPVELSISNFDYSQKNVLLHYWVRVFMELERSSCVRDLTFYVVLGYPGVPNLPTCGNDVVAIVLLDEGCLIPPYLGQIKFVFKTYGFRPWLGGFGRGRMTVLLLMKYVKDYTKWLAHLGRFMYQNSKFCVPRQGRMVVPLGYAGQADLPLKPFPARRYLVSFLGSIEHYGPDYCHRLSPRAWFGAPKILARSRMAGSVLKIASELPDEVFFESTSSFHDSVLTDGRRYSEIMANTKICLAPRGASVETYRFFEALRYGCIVICDRMPSHWFYTGCPAIQLEDWRDLPTLVKALTRDPRHMMKLHSKSVEWWKSVCSEKAVAAAITRSLQSCDR